MVGWRKVRSEAESHILKVRVGEADVCWKYVVQYRPSIGGLVFGIYDQFGIIRVGKASECG